jgi:hypothetical protein
VAGKMGGQMGIFNIKDFIFFILNPQSILNY